MPITITRPELTHAGIRTALPEELIESYLRARYFSGPRRSFTLRVGEFSARLLEAHRARKVSCSAFVTAWNPWGKPLDLWSNVKAQSRLAKRVDDLGLQAIESFGAHEEDSANGEESLLIYGLGLDAAAELGLASRQNAIVWSGEDATPRLILLR